MLNVYSSCLWECVDTPSQMYNIYEGISLCVYRRILLCKYVYFWIWRPANADVAQQTHVHCIFFLSLKIFFLIFFLKFENLPTQTSMNKHMLIGFFSLHMYMYIHTLFIYFFLVCSRDANGAWLSLRMIVEPLQTRTMTFLFNYVWTHKFFWYLCVGQPAVLRATVSGSNCDLRAVENN